MSFVSFHFALFFVVVSLVYRLVPKQWNWLWLVLASCWFYMAMVPAYILSELRTGFQIGAVLFFPFLIIDLVVASVTLSIGMVQLPPVMLSAPFKILLFVLVDGWNLVIGSLVRSFYSGAG